MIDLKTIILITILAIFLGVAIFIGISFAKGTPVSLSSTTFAGINEKNNSRSDPAPTPKPSLPPLPENADLGQELQKIEMPDFSSDYQNLRDQIR